MSGFAAEWLALREPYDATARNAAILDSAIQSLAGLPSVNIVDLACGTGSTLRALSPRLPGRQNWRLVDNDLGLLARASADPPAGAMLHAIPLDLIRDLEAALDGPVDLVTASALLDLVSEEWLERLVVEIAARRIPLYAALSYDGRIEFDPADGVDAAIVDAFNRHQRTDKGFGTALGPGAAEYAVAQLKRAGYSVNHGTSDWLFAPHDDRIQIELLSGFAKAAREIGVMPIADIENWLARRSDLVTAGRSTIRVGHVDIFARPTATL
jgi:hypothetical protein